MKRIIDLSHNDAKAFYLKGSSYFNSDLPPYISFDPILEEVASVLNGKNFPEFKNSNPSDLPDVNYSFIANKDGKFAWRPYELMHPVIYVSLINVICEESNWKFLKERFSLFEGGVVECCSAPVVSADHNSDMATQIKSWWHKMEQRSLEYSLQFSHLLHTDVTDCYGSLYTHSIAWAVHGLENAKRDKRDASTLGNKIDFHIQSGRYGQTNGISQGSALMDFVAELVLGYVDDLIRLEIGLSDEVRVLRYRDDYRIFANSDETGEATLKVVSDKLRSVGMKLGVSKTFSSRNIIAGSIKPDKLAGIDLQDLGNLSTKTIQKELLRLHSFGQRYPNSGALRRLVSEFQDKILEQKTAPDDLKVQLGIATDIAFESPSTFPGIAGIISHLLSLSPPAKKVDLWTAVSKKMKRVPYNGYLEMWLQRIAKPKAVGVTFESTERICQIVDGKSPQLWESGWISSPDLLKALNVKTIVVSDAEQAAEVIQPSEVQLFKESIWAS